MRRPNIGNEPGRQNAVNFQLATLPAPHATRQVSDAYQARMQVVIRHQPLGSIRLVKGALAFDSKRP
jgi:hypothetical protein